MTPLNCKVKYGAVGQLIPNLEAKIIDLETGTASKHLNHVTLDTVSYVF